VGVSLLCPGYVATNLPQNTVKLGGALRTSAGIMPAATVTSAEVGEQVALAIGQDLPYIITHGGYWPQVEKRFKMIREAFHPPQ